MTAKKLDAPTRSNSKTPAFLPAVLADVCGLLLVFFLLPSWLDLFSEPTFRGGSIILLVFLVLGFGINRVKRLELQSGGAANWLRPLDYSGDRRLLTILALLMILLFDVIQTDLNQLIADSLEIFGNPGEVHEGEVSLYYLFGPTFMWFIVAAVYLAGFMMDTERVIAKDSAAYGLTEFVALAILNLYLVLIAAYIGGVFGRFGLAGSSQIIYTILVFALFLVTFGVARLRHALRNPQIVSVLSFIILLTFALISAIYLF